MVEFFDKHDQRPDVAIAQARAWIMFFKLFNQPPRIINADIEAVVCAPQESSGQLAQFTGLDPGQHRQLRATRAINQAILQIDPDLRVGSLE